MDYLIEFVPEERKRERRLVKDEATGRYVEGEPGPEYVSRRAHYSAKVFDGIERRRHYETGERVNYAYLTGWTEKTALTAAKHHVDVIRADEEIRPKLNDYFGGFNGDPEDFERLTEAPAKFDRVVVYAAGRLRRGLVEHVTRTGNVTVAWFTDPGNEVRRKTVPASKLVREVRP